MLDQTSAIQRLLEQMGIMPPVGAGVNQVGAPGTSPFGTPPFNPNAPAVGSDAAPQMQLPQGPQMPQGPQQQPQQPGILGRLGAMLRNNPQLLQGIAQLAMTKMGGKYGGYAGQGAYQAMKDQQEYQLQQKQLEEQARYRRAMEARQTASDKERERYDRERNEIARAQLGQREKKPPTTITLRDPQTGKNKVWGWNEETGAFDIPVGEEAGKETNWEHISGTVNGEAKTGWRDRSTRRIVDSQGNDITDTFVVGAPTKEGTTTPELMKRALRVGSSLEQPGDQEAKDILKGLEDRSIRMRPPNANQAMPAVPPLTGNTVEERLNSVPANIRPLVKALINYQRVPVGGFATKDPMWKQAVLYAYQVDPAYDEKEFTTRNRMMIAYTSGPPSREINAINTVLGHVGVLDNAIDALNNGDLKRLNALANFLKVETGNDAVTTFNAIVNRVGPELTRSYVGTGGEHAEREINKSDFDPSRGPRQLKSATAITTKLLTSKIGSLGNQWKNTMKRDDFASKFISPEAQAVIDRLGGNVAPGATNPKDPLEILPPE